MTYCLGIKIREGLVCLADGRVTSGSQVSNVRKVSLHGPRGTQVCIMTSGLRSLRDKTLAYFDRALHGAPGKSCRSMLDAVDIYGTCLRQVAEQDRKALEQSELRFNLHSLIAGQLDDDREPTIFLVYPEANWIEVDRRSPYLSIGATAYGKPILDRALSHKTSLQTSLKLAYLSFDSTRTSTADVGFPLDMMTYAAADRGWREVKYDYDDLTSQRTWWNQHITKLANDMPDGPWVDQLLPEAGATRLSLVQDD
jgi:putative proteasome-type protease